MTLAPFSLRYLIVGRDSFRRLSLSTLPSLSGTLKSTRTITRFPAVWMSSTNSFRWVLMGPGLTRGGAGVERSAPAGRVGVRQKSSAGPPEIFGTSANDLRAIGGFRLAAR